mmetsp:Transcript_58255/g.161521  ORF Transcript_58255/g.161521 Transcript_58255/m.161521 type:complete len:175 (-) Transcript_58255:1819-2343(-)
MSNDRRTWSTTEDDAIRQLVKKHGTRSWSVIADHIVSDFNITGRSGKQCRERWHNHLGVCHSCYYRAPPAHLFRARTRAAMRWRSRTLYPTSCCNRLITRQIRQSIRRRGLKRKSASLPKPTRNSATGGPRSPSVSQEGPITMLRTTGTRLCAETSGASTAKSTTGSQTTSTSS